MTSFDLILRGGTVVNQNGVGLADIGVTGGKIAAIGDLAQADAGQIVNATGLHILPGVIDSQVHFREPGSEWKEDLETGANAAALGGVTAVFEMPNTNPTTTTLAALEDKINRGRNRMQSDFAFWFGAAAENVDLLAEAERQEGCAGIKMFMGSSTGDLLVDESEHVARVLANGRRRVAVHSEEESRLNERKGLRRAGDPSSHPVLARPDRRAALHRAADPHGAKRTIAGWHVLHISTADELPILAANKDLITAEATPHHLTFDGDVEYARLGDLHPDESAGAPARRIATRFSKRCARA